MMKNFWVFGGGILVIIFLHFYAFISDYELYNTKKLYQANKEKPRKKTL